MPVSADIYSQIQQPQPVNQLAQLAQIYQLQNLKREGEQADSAAQQKNRLFALTQDPQFRASTAQEKANRLLGEGYFREAGDVITSAAAANKDQRAADAASLDMQLKKMEAMGQIMSGVRDQATYDIARQHAAQIFGPEAAANISPIYNAQEVEQRKVQALAVKDRLQQQVQLRSQDITRQNNIDTNNTSRANNADNLAMQRQKLNSIESSHVVKSSRPTAERCWWIRALERQSLSPLVACPFKSRARTSPRTSTSRSSTTSRTSARSTRRWRTSAQDLNLLARDT